MDYTLLIIWITFLAFPDFWGEQIFKVMKGYNRAKKEWDEKNQRANSGLG